MERIDTDRIREALCEHFPDWSAWISRVEFLDVNGVQPVDNDGRSVLFNSLILRYHTEETQKFYFAQQLLHLRLQHCARGMGRYRRLWKRASDATVNEMLREDGFAVPASILPNPLYSGKSAEEIYNILLDEAEIDDEAEDLPPELIPQPVKPEQSQAGKNTQGSMREIDDPGLAAAVRGLAELLEPSLQLDFDWFPGDTIRDGMLRDRFRAYPVSHTEIVLDTSASVDSDLLRAFIRGVKALMREDAVIRVGCFDTKFYGFHDIVKDADIDALELRGAGGTDFSVAVAAFSGDAENRIIFTDGYAEMPEQRCDCIWVVYGTRPIHPRGGRVLYAKPPMEKEKHEIDFLIT